MIPWREGGGTHEKRGSSSLTDGQTKLRDEVSPGETLRLEITAGKKIRNGNSLQGKMGALGAGGRTFCQREETFTLLLHAFAHRAGNLPHRVFWPLSQTSNSREFTFMRFWCRKPHLSVIFRLIDQSATVIAPCGHYPSCDLNMGVKDCAALRGW